MERDKFNDTREQRGRPKNNMKKQMKKEKRKPRRKEKEKTRRSEISHEYKPIPI
jgi:hypothetical protein